MQLYEIGYLIMLPCLFLAMLLLILGAALRKEIFLKAIVLFLAPIMMVALALIVWDTVIKEILSN